MAGPAPGLSVYPGSLDLLSTLTNLAREDRIRDAVQLLEAYSFPSYNARTYGGAKGDGTDATTAIQAALTDGAGGHVVIPPGSYGVSGTLNVPADTTVTLQGATITALASLANGIFMPNGEGITFQGRYTYNGNAKATDFIHGSPGAHYLRHTAYGTVSGIPTPNYWINLTGCNHPTVAGKLKTIDSPAVRIDRSSHVEVIGLRPGPYSLTLGNNPVIAVEDFIANGVEDVLILGCHVDGGSQLAGYAGIVVGQAFGGGTHLENARVIGCSVKNTTGGSDGIDFVQVDNGAIVACHVIGTNNGIDVAGCNFIGVSASTAKNCRSAGFQCGDITVAFQTNVVTYTDCIAIACGIGGQVDFTAAGFVILAPAATSTNLVTLANCIGYNAGNAAMKYGVGLGKGAGGTMSTISVTGGFMLGSTLGFLDSSGLNVVAFRQVGGINPQAGAAVVGAFPWTNTNPYDVLLTFVANAAGSTPTVSGKAMSAVPANQVGTVIVPAGAAISFNNAPASAAGYGL